MWCPEGTNEEYASSIVFELSSLFCLHPIAPVRPNEPHDADNQNKFDGEMEAVKDSLEARIGVPVVA